MAITEAYVFIEMPNESAPVLAGRLNIDPGNNTGSFIYGKSYLARTDAFAFDPINLPLTDSLQMIHGNDGVPTVLLDAGPDNWGQRLMQALHSKHPENKLELLLAGRGTGAGAISLSLSRAKPKSPPEYRPLSELTDLDNGIQRMIEEGVVTPEILRQLEPGSSMGGARPKSVVADENQRLWIAKFGRPDDIYDQVKTEEMCFRMMRDCGIATAPTKLITPDNRSILLVERFDQPLVAGGSNRHFISGHALTYRPRIKQNDAPFHFSYPKLADIITQIGHPDDLQELYRRLIFNILSSNTDDHMRNHGFLKNVDDNFYRISPAYDVVTQLSNSGLQAIGVGDEGRKGSIHNALSACGRFRLSEAQAHDIIQSVQEVTCKWQEYAASVSLSDTDINILAGVLNRHESSDIDFSKVSSSLAQLSTKTKGPSI
ncbi:type II toxin-antitoxin system HipA family toxin [uncultured Amphritea sp.]|uniref:type II toxin-antitoxin system HipA family toxin n=1 Tax=uncultured Amphritea sp. TaxID=981605 RepID=UPI00262FCBFA|nr:type II toxin-antitoxin system HipA family toxin [uncultured Amphritea sp.]